MAFNETPAEKKKRQDWEMANLKSAKAKEAKADAEDMRKFNETTKVDTSENTNPMGDTYKKGGKVMKKRYASGGIAEGAEDAGLGKLKRLGLKPGTADYRLGQKTLREDKTAQELEDLLPSREKIGSALRSKLNPEVVMDAANPVGAIGRRAAEAAKDVKMPKSYDEESGMKRGGTVKRSSASKRADGCAIRGKTRA
jgi:hypothetical protein